jgi:methylated-DNA-[protein]-cysteine S-methyltransferase
MSLDKKIYKKLLEVPEGKITTYGELAKAVGFTNGQRAVGKIMNKNPYPVIMICLWRRNQNKHAKKRRN